MASATDSTDRAGGESLIGGGAGDPNQLWATAQDLAGRGSLRSATSAFEEFIASHPNDERVPEAHFQLADILEQQKRPQDALETFQNIQRLYPTSPKVPEALYRIAELQIELDDVSGAKATLERIMNTYPGSMMAMLARDRLDEIG